MLYLASPYVDPSAHVMQQRYYAACEACAGLVKQQIVVYSPIVHWHAVAEFYNLPRSHPFWQFHNHAMIAMSYEFSILMLDGWVRSKGIADDLQTAKVHGVRITYRHLHECTV